MGGMTTLEYPLITPKGYVRHIIPIATSARHSAWCISWGEAQRQSIYSDPAYDEGYYCYSDDEEDGYRDPNIPADETAEEKARRIEERQPTRGLAAARMAALLTYRSRDSFESRFGRKYGAPVKRGRGGRLGSGSGRSTGTSTPLPSTPRGEENLRAHNDGHRARTASNSSATSSKVGTPAFEKTQEVLEKLQVPLPTVVDQDGPVEVAAPSGPEVGGSQTPLTNLELSMPGGSRTRTPMKGNGKTGLGTGANRPTQVFSAQSYLRYQGDKVSLKQGDLAVCLEADSVILVHISFRRELLHPHHPQNGHTRHLLPLVHYR